MDDIYASPKADLDAFTSDESPSGSLDEAVKGNYRFNAMEIIREAGAKMKGAKRKLLSALVIYALVVGSLSGIFQFLPIIQGFDGGIGFSILGFVIQTLVPVPLMMGLIFMGARRSVGAPFLVGSLFDYFKKMIPLCLTSFLMTFCIALGFVALIIPGIYLSMAYSMALPLVAEKGLGPWQALETSRKTVGKRWFAFAGFTSLLGLINLLALLAVGIGLIWTLPMSIVAYGIAYRNMFGLGAETLST